MPWLIVPVKVPANLAGPWRAGRTLAVLGLGQIFACSRSVELILDLADCFCFGASDFSAAGVGFSSDSTIGAGSRCAATKIDNATSSMRRVRLAPAERFMGQLAER